MYNLGQLSADDLFACSRLPHLEGLEVTCESCHMYWLSTLTLTITIAPMLQICLPWPPCWPADRAEAGQQPHRPAAGDDAAAALQMPAESWHFRTNSVTPSGAPLLPWAAAAAPSVFVRSQVFAWGFHV